VIPIADLDEWRAAYPTATYAEQRAFHSRIWEANPDQNHFCANEVALALDHMRPNCSTTPFQVVELGGWDGQLAELMLDRYPGISRWSNIELCHEAAMAGHGRHRRYWLPNVKGWYWQYEWRCHLFVASHVIEHLSAGDLDKVIAATDALALFFDAPLEDYAIDWNGSPTTHTLDVGWEGVTDICARHGYSLTWAHGHDTPPSSGGHARACLYECASSA